MKFYTNICRYGNKIRVRGYDQGIRFREEIKYRPYVFVSSPKDSEYKTLDGRNASRVDFDSMSECREFLFTYQEVENFKVFGLSSFEHLFIYDNYNATNYDVSKINIVPIDIEVSMENGLPSTTLAQSEITAITMFSRGKYISFGCKEYIAKDKNIIYVKCDDEIDMLVKFLKVWNSGNFNPDVVTGWNVRFFDMPYLYNRIKRVISEPAAKSLSPYLRIQEEEVEVFNKLSPAIVIAGIAILDYYQVYRKFAKDKQEAYTLDFISQAELGEAKVNYEEYKNLDKLYENNFEKFMDYNIHDVRLVVRLEEKLKFLELVFAFSYMVGLNYEDTFTSVRPWTVLIHNYLRDKNTVIPIKAKKRPREELMGGYCKDPKVGFSKWVVSLDVASMYPSIIKMFSISPETRVETSLLTNRLKELQKSINIQE